MHMNIVMNKDLKTWRYVISERFDYGDRISNEEVIKQIEKLKNNLESGKHISDERRRELLTLELWNAEQLAEFMGRSIGTIRNMIARKEIPCVRRINAKLFYINVKGFIDWFQEKPETTLKKKTIQNKKRRL